MIYVSLICFVSQLSVFEGGVEEEGRTRKQVGYKMKIVTIFKNGTSSDDVLQASPHVVFRLPAKCKCFRLRRKRKYLFFVDSVKDDSVQFVRRDAVVKTRKRQREEIAQTLNTVTC